MLWDYVKSFDKYERLDNFIQMRADEGAGGRENKELAD
jgi:hypothetical protein